MMLLSIDYDTDTNNIEIKENKDIVNLKMSSAQNDALILESLATALGMKVKTITSNKKVLDTLFNISRQIVEA